DIEEAVVRVAFAQRVIALLLILRVEPGLQEGWDAGPGSGEDGASAGVSDELNDAISIRFMTGEPHTGRQDDRQRVWRDRLGPMGIVAGDRVLHQTSHHLAALLVDQSQADNDAAAEVEIYRDRLQAFAVAHPLDRREIRLTRLRIDRQLVL